MSETAAPSIHNRIQDILSRLEDVVVEKPGVQWNARCPCTGHGSGKGDNRPSLTVGVGEEERLILHCFAGCSSSAVMLALNLPLSTLFAGQSSGDHGAKGKRKGGGKKSKGLGKIVAVYNYTDAAGQLVMQVPKYDPKDYRQRRPRVENPDDDNPEDWIWSVKDEEKVPYNLPAIITAPPGSTIYIVEGEKDADRLNSQGLIATTNPGGAGKWLDTLAFTEPFLGHHIVILADNDDVGRQHGQDVARKLQGVARSIKVIELPGLPPKGDVSDWMQAGGTREQLEAIVAAAPLWMATPIKPVESNKDPDRLARLVLLSLENAIYWHSEWYIKRENDYCYRRVSGSVMDATAWRVVKSEFNRINVEAITEAPGKTHVCLEVSSGLIKNVVAAMRAYVEIGDAVEFGSWIENPPRPFLSASWGDEELKHRRQSFVSMTNGILKLDELMGGAPISEFLIPHDPRWFSPITLPYAFNWNAQCPIFDSYLRTSIPDAGCQALLQEWAGYLLGGTTTLQKFLILEGEGQNGKSVYLAIMEAMIGSQNCSHVPLDQLYDKFQITETFGKMANISADVGEIDKTSEGLLKSLASGDKQLFSRKFLPGINATPTARLMLATNNRIRFSDKSSGIWRRMLLIPFTTKIEEADRIEGLDQVDWWNNHPEELAGVLNWGLMGLQQLRSNGHFTIPLSCQLAIDSYRSDCNPASAFLKDTFCGADGHDAIVTTEVVYGRYVEFCRSNGFQALSSNAFGREVTRAFPGVERDRRRVEGKLKHVFQGLMFSEVVECDL